MACYTPISGEQGEEAPESEEEEGREDHEAVSADVEGAIPNSSPVFAASAAASTAASATTTASATAPTSIQDLDVTSTLSPGQATKAMLFASHCGEKQRAAMEYLLSQFSTSPNNKDREYESTATSSLHDLLAKQEEEIKRARSEQEQEHQERLFMAGEEVGEASVEVLSNYLPDPQIPPSPVDGPLLAALADAEEAMQSLNPETVSMLQRVSHALTAESSFELFQEKEGEEAQDDISDSAFQSAEEEDVPESEFQSADNGEWSDDKSDNISSGALEAFFQEDLGRDRDHADAEAMANAAFEQDWNSHITSSNRPAELVELCFSDSSSAISISTSSSSDGFIDGFASTQDNVKKFEYGPCCAARGYQRDFANSSYDVRGDKRD